MRTLSGSVLIAGLAAAIAAAQTGGPYDLRWSTVDAGGGRSAGGGFVLAGTAGQPDAGLSGGGLYQLQGGFWYGGDVATGVADDPRDATPPVLEFSLHGAAPNPFNPRTGIAFDLPRAGPVRLVIYDLRGIRVRTLVDEALPAGRHVRAWDGTDDDGASVASGTYLVRISAGEHEASGKAVLVR